MFRFALRNLLSRPLRSSLSLLGLAVAIGGMVGLFSIAGGIDAVVKQTFEQVPGLLVQQRGAPIPLLSTLPADWEEDLRRLPEVSEVDPLAVSWISTIDEEVALSPPRFLVGTDIPTRQRLRRDLYRDNVIVGRFLDEKDVGSNACLISLQIAQRHGKMVGDRITVNHFECRVVGIYETGSVMLDGNVVMDIHTMRRIARISPERVAAFYVEPRTGVDAFLLKHHIELLFHGRDPNSAPSSEPAAGGAELFDALFRGTGRASGEDSPPPRDDSSPLSGPPPLPISPVEVRAAEDWSQRFSEFSGDLDLFLVLMTAIGVLIAVLSIINTMMMSVTERTVEFGILRANGWSQGQIMRLMTLESGLLGSAGGVVGVCAGWLGTLAANWYWPDRVHLYAGPGLLVFGFAFSVMLGIVGGLYPAWAAARLSPMESIRRG